MGVETVAGVVTGVAIDVSAGSEDGGSLEGGVAGFRGVRNGDLKGLWRVFVASFSRRRLFACGVDSIVGTSASEVVLMWSRG